MGDRVEALSCGTRLTAWADQKSSASLPSGTIDRYGALLASHLSTPLPAAAPVANDACNR